MNNAMYAILPASNRTWLLLEPGLYHMLWTEAKSKQVVHPYELYYCDERCHCRRAALNIEVS
jgi:hypothetical protein